MDKQFLALLRLIGIPAEAFQHLEITINPNTRMVCIDLVMLQMRFREKGIVTALVTGLLKSAYVDYVQVKECKDWSFWRKFRYLSLIPVDYGNHTRSLLLAGKRGLCGDASAPCADDSDKKVGICNGVLVSSDRFLRW